MYLYFPDTSRRRDIVAGLRGTIDNIGFGVTRNSYWHKAEDPVRVASRRLLSLDA